MALRSSMAVEAVRNHFTIYIFYGIFHVGERRLCRLSRCHRLLFIGSRHRRRRHRRRWNRYREKSAEVISISVPLGLRL